MGKAKSIFSASNCSLMARWARVRIWLYSDEVRKAAQKAISRSMEESPNLRKTISCCLTPGMFEKISLRISMDFSREWRLCS